jgi:hypothetical protein
MNEILAQYEEMLKTHDWTYGWSDDFSVWKRGSAQRKKINAMKKELEESGLDNEAKELYEKYYRS